MISVVITTYNQADCLEAAVASALDQEGEEVEVVVSDDASTDAGPGVIRALEARHRGRLRGVFAERNRGVAANRNAGLAAARGEFLTWLDGDDVFLPGKLARERAALTARPEAGWAYSQVRVRDVETGAVADRYASPPEGAALARIAAMIGRAPRNPLVRAGAWKAVGPFDARMNLYEDFDLVLRLARHFPCAYCPEPGMEYRLHPAGLHAGAADRHARNLVLLTENFLRVTELLPARERRRARRAFLHQGELLLLRGALADGDRSGAARRLARSLALRPESLFWPSTLRTAARLVLPARRAARG
jgi:glycosyltransferase involved in cell wall biosynthesis